MNIHKLMMAGFAALALGAEAADVTWTGLGDGRRWGDAKNWPGDTLPGDGDAVIFPLVKDHGTNTQYEVLVDDSSLADFLKVASVASEDAKLTTFRVVIESDADYVSTVSLAGNAAIVKRGSGRMTLGENTSMAYYYGALTVEEGSLQLATNSCKTAGTYYNYGNFSVGKDAVLLLGDTAGTCSSWPANIKNNFITLNSAGIVSNATAGVRDIVVTANGGSVLSGPICGNGTIRLVPYGDMSITSTNNAFSGIVEPYTSVNPMTFGLAKIGRKSDAASSVGTVSELSMGYYGGIFAYLGEGETTDKTYKYAQSNKTPVGWDAGETGGVTFEGKWYTSSANQMKRMVLSGSNTEKPCVLANEISSVDGDATDGVDYSIYITKKGLGIWRFNDHGSRCNDGVIAVEEGTLQYESIAPKGVMCSLGRATALHQDYDGAYDETKNVDYAYLLGGGATGATFEYVGTAAASCSDRPFVLKGDATVSSLAAPLALAGFSSVAGTANTLTISGGSATDGSIISDVTGALSVVKDGLGEWTLAGKTDFTGKLDVRAGTLNLSQPQYTWFRLVVTGTHGYLNGIIGSCAWLYYQEIALYDAEGRRQNVGLTRLPLTITAGYPASDTDWGDLAKTLDYGQMIIGRNGRFYVQTNYFIEKLVDDTIGNDFGGVYYGSNKYVQTPSESNPYIVTMRLPKDASTVVAYDVCSSSDDDSGYKGCWPGSFRLEGSVDGQDWVVLHAVTNVAVPDVSSWYSDGQALVTGEARKNKGYAFSQKPVAVDALKNVSGVSVAKNARLANHGEAKPISSLIIDATEGAGSFEGLSLATTGTLSLENCPKGDFLVPFSFTGAAANAFEKWTVFIDGRDRTGSVSVTVTADGLQVRRGGYLMSVR